MSEWPLKDGSWALDLATDADFDAIMNWFPDAHSVNIWGGPRFRYPFSGKTFRKDCRIDVMESYVLRSADGQLAAFGQSYARDGRGHLARLVSNPAMRRRGVGKQLIRMLMTALETTHEFDEHSLFVYRDNVPAYQCYLSLGFVIDDYPAEAPMREKCYFLTRKTTRRKR